MKKILFVCLGNICRSPAAHGVMESYICKLGLSKNFYIDSAGTSDHHKGELPDARMRKHALKRGFNLDSPSRPFLFEDFSRFDLIVVMDKSNRSNVLKLDIEKKFENKVIMFCDFCTHTNEEEVPDPYWSGPEGFEYVLDIIEDGVKGILDKYEK